MKRAILNYKKGIMFILALITVGLTYQSCEEVDMTDRQTLKDLVIDYPCKEVCLVAGQHMQVGTVIVSQDGDDIHVTYNVTESGVYLTEIHLDIFADLDQFDAAKKLSGGGAIPGKFEFKKSWKASAMMTSYTVVVPKEYINEIAPNADCFYIASHAALSNGETAWGGFCTETDKGVSLSDAMQFPGNNWGVYFEFCLDECLTTVDFTYAWEDLMKDGADGNDGDYNDLVIKSDVLRSQDMLVISIYASARGASYDHAFKIKIPKTGIVDALTGGINGHADIEEDGDYYIITVFASTKAVLPAENEAPYPFVANTLPTDTDCEPHANAIITILTDENFDFDPDFPYEPFITVHPGTTNAYDLNIWELQANLADGSTWIDEEGKEHPNGIIIPYNWQWPYEKTYIGEAYAGFTSITDGWNPNWADNLTDATKVFDLICE